ncbi:hypothetical protein ES708_32775 [subsurface metagenome]
MGDITSLTGKILEINLSERNWQSWVEKESIHKKFLSARGLSQYYLYQLLRPQDLPLEPQNYIIFGSGLLVGTKTPGATRTNIDSKNFFSLKMHFSKSGSESNKRVCEPVFGSLLNIFSYCPGEFLIGFHGIVSVLKNSNFGLAILALLLEIIIFYFSTI